MTAKIRTASVDDAPRLLEIYSCYVQKTAVSFEYDVPSVEEFAGRIQKTLQKYPYLVIEHEGKILGYAYAGTFKDRAAYNHCVELSIYIDKNAHKRGLGRLLYENLEQRLKERGIKNLYACIAYAEKEDEFLNHNSPDFHSHMGFAKVGEFHKCGYKFNRWYDMIWMEKII